MEKTLMKKEFVFSRIADSKITKSLGNLNNSPIWKECSHRKELDDVAGFYCYVINFKGLTPVQVTHITEH
jgi:hypothetical protein